MPRLRTLVSSRWTRYALTVLLLGLVVLRVHPTHLTTAVRSARPAPLVAALLLTAPFLYLKALRWHILLRSAAVNATFGEALISLVGGMGLALVTPARLGELVRVAYLRGGEKWKVGGLVMIDKGFDVLVLICLSVAGAWRLLGPPAGLAFGLAALAGIALVYEPKPLSLTLRRLPLGARLDRSAGALIALDRKTTTACLLTTGLSFGVVLLQFGIILSCWRSPSLEIVSFTFPLVVLTNVVPLTVGGLGLREGAAALLLAHYGIPASQAAVAAFLMFAINTALPGLVGAFLLPLAGAGPTRDAVQTPDGT